MAKVAPSILILFLVLLVDLFPSSSFGQCPQLNLLDCNCASTVGIDQSEVGHCDYFTRGRREYEDFCGGCPCPEYTFSLFGGLSFATDLERSQPDLPVDILGISLAEGGILSLIHI